MKETKKCCGKCKGIAGIDGAGNHCKNVDCLCHTSSGERCENCDGRGDINIGANVCWKCKGTGKSAPTTLDGLMKTLTELGEIYGDSDYPVVKKIVKQLIEEAFKSGQKAKVEEVREMIRGKKIEWGWDEIEGFEEEIFKTCNVCSWLENDPESAHVCEVKNKALNDLLDYLNEI